MYGKINFENFKVAEMTQEAASAWTAVENSVGANYKPLLYVGSQEVKGINHWFIVEIKYMVSTPYSELAVLAVNEHNGIYRVIPHSVEKIQFDV